MFIVQTFPLVLFTLFCFHSLFFSTFSTVTFFPKILLVFPAHTRFTKLIKWRLKMHSLCTPGTLLSIYSTVLSSLDVFIIALMFCHLHHIPKFHMIWLCDAIWKIYILFMLGMIKYIQTIYDFISRIGGLKFSMIIHSHT